MSVSPVAPQPMVAARVQVINAPTLEDRLRQFDHVGLARRLVEAPQCFAKGVRKFTNRYESAEDHQDSMFHSLSVEHGKCCSRRVHVTNYDPSTKAASMEAEVEQGCCACCSDYVAPMSLRGTQIGSITTPGPCCQILGGYFFCAVCDACPCNSLRIGEIRNHDESVQYRFLRKYCCSSTVRVVNGEGELVTTVQSKSSCQKCLSQFKCQWKYSPNMKVDLAPLGTDGKGLQDREKVLLAMAFFASNDQWEQTY